MSSITQVKIRAQVSVCGITVSTPFVQSFNVRKQRGQVSTFDASLKVSHNSVFGASSGGAVQIRAGEGSANKLIFTGICKTAKVSPCYDDPKYVILSISGADQMILLQGKKYTKRCRSSKSTWVAITSVMREGLKSGKFSYTNEPTIELNSAEQLKESKQVGRVGTQNGPDKITVGTVPSENTLNSVQIIAQILNKDGEV